MKKYIYILFLCFACGVFAQDSPGIYTVENVKINTSHSDFGTAFLGNNKVVFAAPRDGFTLNREEYKGQPFLDLHVAEVSDDGKLIKKQKLPGDVNTKYHEGMVTFSKDMKTVYFSANGKIKRVKRKKDKDRDNAIKTKGTANIHLFKASIDENGEWGNLEMLPFNDDSYSTGHPVLNRDDTKLYFVSDSPESIGRTDIFVVDLYEDGTYGEPVNLGPKINTVEREMFPFIGKDNVLYFSSDGFPGNGELDVFASKIFDNTVSTPINLEAPVNSVSDDFAYIIDDHKHKGYFSSNREGGKGDDDIYSFTASPPIYIECQQEINGVVKNIDTQELIPNVTIILFDESGEKLQTFMSDEKEADFSFMQSCNTSYKIQGFLEGYLVGEMDIQTVNDLNAAPLEIVFNVMTDPNESPNIVAENTPFEEVETESEGKDQINEPQVVGFEDSIASKKTTSSVAVVSDETASKENSDKNVITENQRGQMNSVAAADDQGPKELVKATTNSSNVEPTSINSSNADSNTVSNIDSSSPAVVSEVNKENVTPQEGKQISQSDQQEALVANSMISNDKTIASSENNQEDVEASSSSIAEERSNVEKATETGVVANNRNITQPDLAINYEQAKVDLEGLKINTIYFDFDKHQIRYDAKIELNKLIKVMNDYPEMKIEVNAHTDIRGKKKYNEGLSNKRADATTKYLVENGIDSKRISSYWFGELRPAEKCTKESPCSGFQHQLNRRSEFSIIDKSSEEVIVKSFNRQNTLNQEGGSYTSNSGLFMNYNFYEDTEVYTVQIGAFKGKVQTDKYSKLTNLFNHRYDDGLNRYYSGIFENSTQARDHMKLMRKNGYTGAFVVGLKGENRF